MKRLTVVVLIGALLGQVAACSRPAQRAVASTEPSSTRRAAPLAGESTSPVVEAFKTFALNTLLLPLMDDETPARWADPSFTLDCDDARVAVDGDRLDIGAPVPDRFTVHWHMEACTAMGQGIEMTGDVELWVESSHGGFSASVHPHGLLIRAAAGAHAVNEAFTAVLARVESHRP
jgi:hypothetical protein